MESASQFFLLSLGLYAAGFIGLLAVALLPLRVFCTLRSIARVSRQSQAWRVAFWLIAVAGVVALAVAAPNLTSAVRCLTEAVCGGNRASGWFFFVAIGAVYVMFELVTRVTLFTARKASGVAT
jgi:hypothetical protein